jgi:hypothetical protein
VNRKSFKTALRLTTKSGLGWLVEGKTPMCAVNRFIQRFSGLKGLLFATLFIFNN